MTTSSSARLARSAVLWHAAHAEQTLTEQRPPEHIATHLVVSCQDTCTVLSDLEEHLEKTENENAAWWRELSEAPSPRSTPEFVHVALLRQEVSALERDATVGMIKAEAAGLRTELSVLRERAERIAGELQVQLTEEQSQGWRAREGQAASERALHAQSAAMSRLKASLASESERNGALERQLAELRLERDGATRVLASEAARRHEVDAQLKESERELRATRERGEAALVAAAHRLEAQQALAAKAAAAAAAELVEATDERRRLEGRVVEAQEALGTEAAERGISECAAEQRAFRWSAEVEAAKAAAESEASARREAEAALHSAHDAHKAASDAAREARARADEADERLETQDAELTKARKKLWDGAAAFGRMEESLAAAQDDAVSERERARTLSGMLEAAETARVEAFASEAARRHSAATVEAALLATEAKAAAAASHAAEHRAILENELVSLRHELEEATRARNEATQLAEVTERSAIQRAVSTGAEAARAQRDMALATSRRVAAAKMETRRLRAALVEAEATLENLWQCGGLALLALLPTAEALRVGALAANGPSSWLSLAPPPQYTPRSPRTSDALSAARRVSEAHRRRSNADRVVTSSARVSILRGNEDGSDGDASSGLIEEAVATAEAAAVAAAARAAVELEGADGRALEEEEEECALAAATATTREVWAARLIVLKTAASHSAASARRNAEVKLLTDEMLEIELRARCSRVRRNAAQSRLRELLRSLHSWRYAVALATTYQSARELAYTNAWTSHALHHASVALVDVHMSVGNAMGELYSLEEAHGLLTTQAASQRLETASLAKEAEVHAEASARRAVARAEEEQRTAEARARQEVVARAEAESQLRQTERKLAAARERESQVAEEALQRLKAHQARAAEAAAAAATELAQEASQRRQLELAAAEANRASEAVARELAIAECAMEQREATLSAQLAENRGTAEREAAARRGAELELREMRDALRSANDASCESRARADSAEMVCEQLRCELDDARNAVREATLREGRAHEAARVAREDAVAAVERTANLDAETNVLRTTTSAMMGARESAMARELQLDEGVAVLSESLRDARDGAERAKVRSAEFGLHIGELEQMVLAEADARRLDAAAATEREERLLARIAALEATAERGKDAEAELARCEAAHEVALAAARGMAATATEAGKKATARAAMAEAEAERLRASSDQARQVAELAKAEMGLKERAQQAAEDEARASAQREADALAQLKSLKEGAVEIDAARSVAERRTAAARAEATELRARLDEADESRRGMIAREAAVGNEASQHKRARDVESERTRRLCEEVEQLKRSVADGRMQSRSRERTLEESTELARRELALERAARDASEQCTAQVLSENEKLTSRLHAQLERERSGRSAAERRAAERGMALQAELREAQRETAEATRANERQARAKRTFAAAYCLRLLKGRTRERLRHLLYVWLVAAREADAADRVYASEERFRQQLVVQAQSFQARLDALEWGGRDD